MGKVYARAERILDETTTYLTVGKMYPVTFEDGRLFNITHDHGNEIACLWTDCPHLGGNWTRVVQEVTESTPVITLGTVAPDTVIQPGHFVVYDEPAVVPEAIWRSPFPKLQGVDLAAGPDRAMTALVTVAPDEAGTYLTAGKLCWASDPEDPLQRPVCASCGGEDVTIDATASWDTEAKTWTLLSTDETNSWCEDCGGECSIDWIEVSE